MVPGLRVNRTYILTPTAANPSPAMFSQTGIYLGLGNTPGTIRIQFDGYPGGMSVPRNWFTYELVRGRSKSKSRTRSKSRQPSRSRSKSKNKNQNQTRNTLTQGNTRII